MYYKPIAVVLMIIAAYCLIYGYALHEMKRTHKADWPKLCYYITDVELVSKPLKIMNYTMDRDICSRVKHDAKV